MYLQRALEAGWIDILVKTGTKQSRCEYARVIDARERFVYGVTKRSKV
jgi:hypothetical protein